MPTTLTEKEETLRSVLRAHPSLLVAYSGGIDSLYLSVVAHRVLGSAMRAVIADSASLPRRELAAALEAAARYGFPIDVVRTGEVEDARYIANAPDRCYWCKSELFRVLSAYASQHMFHYLAYGENLDDAEDFRPGRRAAQQANVLAPLSLAALTKADIRSLASKEGLREFRKPAAPCLSSRIAHAIPVTEERLRQIEQAEEFLRSCGLRLIRVRHHGDIARIETEPQELSILLAPELRDQVDARLRALGFKYVTVDLRGYRRGSMNHIVPVDSIASSK